MCNKCNIHITFYYSMLYMFIYILEVRRNVTRHFVLQILYTLFFLNLADRGLGFNFVL